DYYCSIWHTSVYLF
nr:immunoglobulin light chain junction region [Macaca mulatta]MOX29288.1 immunoglobulin light chain junction region [Macaca mulatta]MOX29583.1 immunoglobulin light chain junction region [Macaca mulatta]MOX30974.1 immunoglobulin light chain junction region [Macaca mulatta]MOX31114.1 immunoglobulin light chain junction region [Macaca mulatta]